MQARYYDPVIGRFYSNDPVGFTGEVDTFNRYSYVSNNPYKYTDPDGNSKVAHLIKLTKSGAQNVRSLTSSQAVRARQNGQNIKMINGTKSSAMAIERAANNGSKANILKGGDHAKGHVINKNDVAAGANPIKGGAHVQTNGVQGHTFYSLSTAGVDGVLNAIADGLEGIANGIEWAQDNMPETMGVIEGAAEILDPTRGVDGPFKSDELKDAA